MDMVLVTDFVSTVVFALLLCHLLLRYVSSGARRGGERVFPEEEAGGVAVAVGGGGGGIRRRNRSEKGVRFEGVEEERSVEERCGSEMETAVVEGVGDVVESVGGDEGVESAAVEEAESGRDESALEEKLEVVEERLLLKNISERDGESCGVEFGFGDENAVCSGLNEAVCSADGGAVDELFEEEEGGETRAMDVDDAFAGEGLEKELQDEVADWIEECLRNIEGGVSEEGDSVNEGCKNEFEETAEPKDVADRIGGVIEEEYRVNEGFMNEFEEIEEHKVVDVEIKDTVTEERFGSSEEDDDWEGIEMSELYNDFTAAAAFVCKEEKYDGMSNIGSEVKMQLYGLRKIVMEGPCHEAQPMALKMSARAKWNAWQRLGNMNPEDAMKQYIALVSGINPERAEQNAGVDDQIENVEAKHLSISGPDQSKLPESQSKKEITHDAEYIGTGSSTLY